MSTETKRLYRLEEGKIIGGVCAGLAEYFNIDPTLVRLIWLLVFFMGGTGLLIYIIFWIVLPLKKGGEIVEDSEKKISDSGINSQRHNETDYVFAFFLILLGLIFLLNTTGVISWGVWSVLWRFWPLLIIFAGLNLIVQDSRIFRIIVGFLSIIAFILVFIVSLASSTPERLPDSVSTRIGNWFENTQDLRDVKDKHYIALEDYDNVEKKNINIDMAVGELKLEGEESDSKYITLEGEYYSSFDSPKLESKMKNDELTIDMDLGKKGNVFVFNISQTPRYYVQLGQPSIPTDLSFELGAGKADIVLDTYNIKNLKLSVGAGQTNIDLSNLFLENFKIDVGAGQTNLKIAENFEVEEEIDVHVGAGEVLINIPENYGYEIVTASLGVGTIKLQDEEISGIGKDAQGLRSSNYDDADYIIKFNVDVGVGKFGIK